MDSFSVGQDFTWKEPIMLYYMMSILSSSFGVFVCSYQSMYKYGISIEANIHIIKDSNPPTFTKSLNL